jgi:hypothetical protein
MSLPVPDFFHVCLGCSDKAVCERKNVNQSQKPEGTGVHSRHGWDFLMIQLPHLSFS